MYLSLHWGVNEKEDYTAVTYCYCVSISSVMMGFQCYEGNRQIHSRGENLRSFESHLLTQPVAGWGVARSRAGVLLEAVLGAQ